MSVTEALKKDTIKYVTYWIATVWDEIKRSLTIQKSRKLFGLEEIKRSVMEQDNENSVNELVELANKLPVEIPTDNRHS